MQKAILITCYLSLFLHACSYDKQDESSVNSLAGTPIVTQESRSSEHVKKNHTAALQKTTALQLNNTPATKSASPSKTLIEKEVVEIGFSAAESDLINAKIPIYDKEEFDSVSVNFFFNMGRFLNGKAQLAKNPDNVLNIILEILQQNTSSGTDVVILLDKTYSMWDDIDEVRHSLDLIIQQLSKHKNVNLSLVTYGDKNYHDAFWYDRVELTKNFDLIRDFMTKVTILGNPDHPESVNDAIVKTVDELQWTPGSKRLMLVVGDAASQEPPLSNYSSNQVIEKCKAMGVSFNLYPVIISLDASVKTQKEFAQQDIFQNIYPNPANVQCTLSFYEDGIYTVDVIDFLGNIVQSERVSGISSVLSLSGLASGKYLIRAYSEKYKSYAAQIVMVEH